MQQGCANAEVGPGSDGAPRHRGWLDRLGIGVSVTCAAHCVAASVLTVAPALASGAAGTAVLSADLAGRLEAMEPVFLLCALVFGALSLIPGYLRLHRDIRPLVAFGLGLGVLALGQSAAGELIEIGATVIGATLIASAHVLNLKIAPAHSHS